MYNFLFYIKYRSFHINICSQNRNYKFNDVESGALLSCDQNVVKIVNYHRCIVITKNVEISSVKWSSVCNYCTISSRVKFIYTTRDPILKSYKNYTLDYQG